MRYDAEVRNFRIVSRTNYLKTPAVQWRVEELRCFTKVGSEFEPSYRTLVDNLTCEADCLHWLKNNIIDYSKQADTGDFAELIRTFEKGV